MKFTHHLPETNLLFEKGGLDRLGEKTRDYGNKALIVTDEETMEELGFLKQAKDSLKEAGLEVAHYNGVKPNPTQEIVDRGAEFADKENCDVVVALGGGSTIDTAKSIAVVAGHEDDMIWNFVPESKQGRGKEITEKTLPIIAVPTTSGTGSHVTPYAVLTHTETRGKPGFGDTPMFPKVSIVDVNLTKEMPQRLTALTGFDVFAHVSENIVAKGDHPIADPWATEAMTLVSQYLPRVVEDGEDMEAREMMALADTYAGLSNTSSATNLRNAMAHSISGHYPEIAHGQALTSISVPIMRFNVENGDERTRQRYAMISQCLGGERDPKEAIQRLEELIEDIGLDKTLSELGVEEEKIPQMAQDAFDYMKGDVENNPVKVSVKDVEKLFKESY